MPTTSTPPVATVSGVGTEYTIVHASTIAHGPYRFAVYVASGPATRLVADGRTWADAMDVVRDAVAAELCTSDDPTNHQGDTCPIHEDADDAWGDHRIGAGPARAYRHGESGGTE